MLGLVNIIVVPSHCVGDDLYRYRPSWSRGGFGLNDCSFTSLSSLIFWSSTHCKSSNHSPFSRADKSLICAGCMNVTAMCHLSTDSQSYRSVLSFLVHLLVRRPLTKTRKWFLASSITTTAIRSLAIFADHESGHTHCCPPDQSLCYQATSFESQSCLFPNACGNLRSKSVTVSASSIVPSLGTLAVCRLSRCNSSAQSSGQCIPHGFE